MITETEKQRLNDIRDELLKSLKLQFMGEEIPDELMSEVLGINLGIYDALFAIREGESWRGMSNPAEIAGVVLRQASIGDPE